MAGSGRRVRQLPEVFFELVAHQRPDLLFRVLARDLAANLGVIVFRAGAGTFAGDCEAVFQHQHAEGQQAQRGIRANWGLLGVGRSCGGGSLGAFCRREEPPAGNVGLQVSRRDARCGLAGGSDVALDRKSVV